MWVISSSLHLPAPSFGADGWHSAVTGLVTAHPPSTCDARGGGVPQCGGMTRMLEVTPPALRTPTTTCAPLCPRHALFPHWPEIVVAVTDAHTRARPCAPPGRRGGTGGCPHPLYSTHLFYVLFLCFSPFPPSPSPPFLSCRPPHSSLSLSSLHFSKVSQPCPPHVGATRMGTLLRLGSSLPQSEDPLSLGTPPSRMGTPCLDGDLHRLRTSLPG